MRLNDLVLQGKYVWDLPPEMMYPERLSAWGINDSLEQEMVEMLKEAEHVSAELMDDQSDSDSEDERVLKSTFQRDASPNRNRARSTCVSNHILE
mmetsp:Transcript_93338/g.170944  ORF Transcript_93338/g.170944 Transcript_93338/m.170944 type:complete len:95 (+) Transcript_93338:2-286(+)